MNNTFLKTGAKQPLRGNFNLSYEKKLTCDMGEIIPILCEQTVPGDVFNINNAIMLRMQPLVAPVMHEINIKCEYFFVPLRLAMGSLDEDDYANFMTGGLLGDDTTVLDTFLPATSDTDIGTLWDYFGFPTTGTPGTPLRPTGTLPLMFPWSVYNKIWNEWYRDENLQTERTYAQNDVAYRNWEKDYFTASLPWLQRGTAGALPVIGSAVWDVADFSNASPSNTWGVSATGNIQINNANQQQAVDALEKNTLSATSVSISDLRVSVQLQKFQELNARAGIRLTENIQAHWGVNVGDSRLQRSEFIGATQRSITISEVLKTSQEATGTEALGTMAGHGISAGRNRIAKYRAPEHGILMGLMTIMPRTVYQQGINRQWLYETRFDWPDPLFVNLSEQEVLQGELFVTDGNATENETIFGYIGRYDEMRYKPSMIVADMRDDFKHWHISRIFSSAPLLNSSFISMADARKDIFAVPSEDGFIVNVGNIITAVRPIPTMNRPGVLGL